MKLTVATPFEIVLDTAEAAAIRAEDATGAFGILPGHADFLTVLAVSVVTWRDPAGTEHHLAVRGGMLQVQNGTDVAIDTREAVMSDDLTHLKTEVLAAFRQDQAEDQAARLSAERLYLNALRRITQLARPGARSGLEAG